MRFAYMLFAYKVPTVSRRNDRNRLEEQQFLASYDPSQFDRPSVTVDVVILTLRAGRLEVLLTQRKEHPFKGFWSLPGGFVGMQESLDEAAARVLRSKGGLEGVYLEQLYTFGAPQRDPRTRVISVAYYALVEPGRIQEREGNALFRVVVPWEGEAGGPVEVEGGRSRRHPLAFDHAEILGMAVRRIRGKLEYAPIGFELLPERFTLRQLQQVHETILGRKLNKDSFRRRMLASGRLEPTGELESGTGYRPAELYTLKKDRP